MNRKPKVIIYGNPGLDSQIRELFIQHGVVKRPLPERAIRWDESNSDPIKDIEYWSTDSANNA